jgi:hypothetical protein
MTESSTPVDLDGQPVQPDAEDTGENVETGQQDPAAPASAAPPEEPIRTPEDFQRALNARVKAIERKYANYGELKDKAAKLKEVEDAQKTSEQKLRDDLAAAQEARTKAEREARETTLRSSVVAEAIRLGFNDPMDAFNLLDKSSLTQAEGGDVEGITEALNELARSKPYLRQKSVPPVPPANPSREESVPKRTDADRRSEYFTGAATDFWTPRQ